MQAKQSATVDNGAKITVAPLLNHWQLFIARRARHSGEPLKPWAGEQKICPHDEAPLALMRANPGTRSTEIIRMNGRPRNSTVSSLQRLEKAGLVEHAGRGKWIVVPPGSDPGADLLEAADADAVGPDRAAVRQARRAPRGRRSRPRRDDVGVSS
jgi:hypothetical protein